MLSGDEEKSRDSWKKAELATMANMKQDLSTHRHGVAFADWSAHEVKQNRTRERTQELTDLEVLQHALCQQNDEAWSQLCARFQSMVLSWAQNHPQRDLASRYHAPDFSVALAFERFRQATTRHPSLVFSELATVLSYLKASLNGAILDTLRYYTRPEEPLPEAGQLHPAQRATEDLTSDGDLWKAMKQLLSSSREQRVAYLLFHCGLKPREIVQYCPEEFPQIEEVYRFRRTIVDRLLHHADLLSFRIGEEE